MKDVLGPRAGVFQQCPEDPASVHPVRFPEGEMQWPDGPAAIEMAGRLAGL